MARLLRMSTESTGRVEKVCYTRNIFNLFPLSSMATATATTPAKTKNELMEMTDTETVKAIRQELKSRLPECKFSVRKQSYSMGWSISVNLMQAPFAVFVDSSKEYAQLNQYILRREGYQDAEGNCNGSILTPYGWRVMQIADEITQAFNWDESDAMSDYYNVNFSCNLEIGKWNKPFQVVQK